MDIEFEFIGWNNTTDWDGKKHDKVWTAFSINETYYAGWGARGKALSFKKYGSGFSAKSQQSKKIKEKKLDSYSEVDAFLLFSIFPNFQEDVEKRLVYCTLANKVK